MKTYTYDFSIKTSSETEALAKMEALAALANRYDAKQLADLQNYIKKNPQKADQFIAFIATQ